MGAGGQEYGIALYEEKGAIEKLSRLYDEGRVPEAATLRSIAVTMNDEPVWAIKAVKEAFGLARLPLPMKVARGAPGPVDAIDLATLATALMAVAKLTPRKTETSARLEADCEGRGMSGEIVVTARVPRLFTNRSTASDCGPRLTRSPTSHRRSRAGSKRSWSSMRRNTE